jgi:predicted phage terminase large subunit-like protein
MIAAGVGGPLTGQGADLAIIDDPVKGPEEANSQLQRDSIWDWYRFVLRTRLQPNAAVILVLTRWHEDDLAGRLLKAAKEDPAADQWIELKLPALAEDDDPLGRALGEPLWPGQYSREALQAIKASIGTYAWLALFQQRPISPQGAFFHREWWKHYRERPGSFDQVIQSWDMTFKETRDTDFVVGQVWGKVGAFKYLLDQVRGRMSFTTTLQAVRTLSARWPEATTKLVEDKANGPAVIDSLNRELGGFIPVEPQGGKEARAAAVSPQVEAGNVFLPEGAPWLDGYIEEHAAFPKGANDDQVDATTQALIRLAEGGAVVAADVEDKTYAEDSRPY